MIINKILTSIIIQGLLKNSRMFSIIHLLVIKIKKINRKPLNFSFCLCFYMFDEATRFGLIITIRTFITEGYVGIDTKNIIFNRVFNGDKDGNGDSE